MKTSEFITKLNSALNSNTIYCTGMFGQPITNSAIEAKAKQYPSNYSASKVAQLKALIGKNYFGFDCICLIKGILWGWNGDSTKAYGGAIYASNGVPDIGTESAISYCTNVSTDFTRIVPGALVWMKGHVGVYIGNGEVIECTGKWTNNVLKSTLQNTNTSGPNLRAWTKWGKMNWLDYSGVVSDGGKKNSTPSPSPVPNTSTSTMTTGKIIHLNNAPLFNSSTTSTVASRRTGDYWLWSSEIIGGRIRITNAANRVGVVGQVTGWVNISDINKSTQSFMFNGLDYSPVFNPSYYSEKYDDLKKAFGNDSAKLFNHFKSFGMNEGRQAIATFDVQTYKSLYSDLQNAFGSNLPAYYRHYLQYGIKENRKAIR